jgi:hypothetical protein
MAKINLLAPIAFIRGKLLKSDEIYFAIRYGKQIGVRLRKPWTHRPTPTQRLHQQRMRLCNQQVHAILIDAQQRDYYHHLWLEHERLAKTNTSLRSFYRLRDFIYFKHYQSLTQNP